MKLLIGTILFLPFFVLTFIDPKHIEALMSNEKYVPSVNTQQNSAIHQNSSKGIIYSIGKKKNSDSKRSILPFDSSKTKISSSNLLLADLPILAFIANYGYCMPYKNIFGRVVGKRDIVANGGLYVSGSGSRFSSSKIVIYFKGKRLTKAELVSRKPELVPFKYPGQKQKPFVLVDKEWFDDVKKMWPLINQEISRNMHEQRKELFISKIYFIGHAVGGAYATLASALWSIHKEIDFHSRNYEDIGLRLITFGAPRVGNRKFAQFVNLKVGDTNRVTYGNDYFPQFPARKSFNPLAIMEHPQTEIWIKPTDNNCDCIDANDEIELEYYLCKGKINKIFNFLIPSFLRLGENPKCNAAESSSNLPDSFIHQGPYFGTLMGECEGFEETGIQKYNSI
ncbi:hypothetical protein G9A89_014009 [Geosiphon pyriformis]|nr:hypothetical protein G9A89_014009 [Geosiphon pyriformis]